ncbi:substrate-binding domain-containing protein [Asaia prunellae]|uniref:hypothetical protein n=1 Tax=Asaia prunellae TaxID=610245 RepID=UPI00046FFDE0|nr:hypothetical protein [Asaia prunellae]
MGAGGVLLATALQTRSFFHRHKPIRTDGKKRHIRLAWPEPDYDPLLWLCQQGIFGRYDLTVDLVETSGGNSAIDAVVTSRADAALSPLLDWLPVLYQDEEDELPAVWPVAFAVGVIACSSGVTCICTRLATLLEKRSAF